ncbi:MAG: hypothetical protein Q8J68_01880 [Methanolobus sp.]|uniref:hypothetical protein n=1 Tax=Methanolobus sp. TaxID=1874737 RepID=UPI00272F7151|nr:hypothetical protein [Methanolobus sp.]MDP2216025.1 hypothetical protein [Methanolobus sp.]
MNFAPVSCMCLYCKERTFIRGQFDRVTCLKCREMMKVITGWKLRLSRIPVIPGENASNLPVV